MMNLSLIYKDKHAAIWLAMIATFAFWLAWLVIIPEIQYYTFDEFILDDKKLIALSDEGYMEVCRYYFNVGTSCVVKKDWVDMKLENQVFQFYYKDGNGCQYFEGDFDMTYDGMKANNGKCSAWSFGSYQPTWHVYSIGNYYVKENIDRNSQLLNSLIDKWYKSHQDQPQMEEFKND